MSAAALVDSPFFTGEFSRLIPLTPQAPATRLSIFADASADLAIKDDDIAKLRRVVAEAEALFGARHYRQYAWLVGLGDTLTSNGVEHHESTDIRMNESLFTKPEFMQRWASVFAHEYVHSWNGKYRRPEGLVHSNFQQPLEDNLLWVYEGMTRYLGDFVLRGRAGFGSPEFMRDLPRVRCRAAGSPAPGTRVAAAARYRRRRAAVRPGAERVDRRTSRAGLLCGRRVDLAGGRRADPHAQRRQALAR
jgi:predicted metalloprotease with PDZ domain